MTTIECYISDFIDEIRAAQSAYDSDTVDDQRCSEEQETITSFKEVVQ